MILLLNLYYYSEFMPLIQLNNMHVDNFATNEQGEKEVRSWQNHLRTTDYIKYNLYQL